MSARERRLAYAALLLQTAISGGTYLLGKFAIGQLGWAAAVMLRNLGSSALFLALLAARAAPLRPPRASWGRTLLLGLLVVPGNQALFFSGLGRTSPVHASLLFALTPAFVLALSLGTRTERLQPTKLLGVLLAVAGAALVVLERSAGVTTAGASLTGDLLVLGAVLAWAVYTTLSRRYVQAHGPVRATSWTLVAGTLLFLPYGVPQVAELSAPQLTWPVLGAMAFIVTCTGFISYLCWYYALVRLEPSRVAVFTNLQPLVTALLAWWLRDEPLTPRLALGGAVIVTGVLLATRTRSAGANESPLASASDRR